MRSFPRSLTKAVQIYRSVTNGGTRSYPASPTCTIEGAFQPQVRRSHSLEGNMYVIEYEVFFDANADVLRGDKLVIDGTTYFVRNLLTSEATTMSFTIAYISKEA